MQLTASAGPTAVSFQARLQAASSENVPPPSTAWRPRPCPLPHASGWVTNPQQHGQGPTKPSRKMRTGPLLRTKTQRTKRYQPAIIKGHQEEDLGSRQAVAKEQSLQVRWASQERGSSGSRHSKQGILGARAAECGSPIFSYPGPGPPPPPPAARRQVTWCFMQTTEKGRRRDGSAEGEARMSALRVCDAHPKPPASEA